MLFASSCELFISYITRDLIILLYMCIIYWWSFLQFLSFFFYCILWLCFVHAYVCVCVYWYVCVWAFA